ncbi:hypothetical protein VaNZ11_011521 [Volvox africanus]|uniref:Glycosyl transferase CAP10 domain-containing protein n=1 Tax=Volvox africanus TaxID=51714 RepID=A0ABQ5SCY3_9CHLO|nr:hypothetical protein VaNZ11_011521 [Volvox africanus]
MHPSEWSCLVGDGRTSRTFSTKMPKGWVLIVMIIFTMYGGLITPRQSALVAGSKDAVHAVRKPRRSRRSGPQVENFAGFEPVTEVPLSNYGWIDVESTMGVLLEAGLGPEVAYWKRREVKCDDIAHTVKDLHTIFLDSVRVVLIYNQTWHFLDPVPHQNNSNIFRSGNVSDGARGTPGESPRERTSRFEWPLLAPSPPDTCSSPCQTQLNLVHQAIASRLAGWRSKEPPKTLRPPRYSLPDMVLIINAADNMQRFGAGSRAPVLSLMKWWRIPWTASSQQGARAGTSAKVSIEGSIRLRKRLSNDNGSSRATDADSSSPSVSLGRVDGELLRPLDLPTNTVRLKANTTGAAATGTESSTSAATSPMATDIPLESASADPLWDMVRRFVTARPLDLPPGVEVAPSHREWRRKRKQGRSDAAAAGTGAGEDNDYGEDEKYFENRSAARRRDYDMDLLLPTMAYAPRSLSYFPWELKKDIAYFRGIAFCPLYPDLHPICPRALLANVTAAGWFQNDLDVRLVRRFKGRLGSKGQYRQIVSLKGAKFTAPRDHARYRYLLNMDGLAGSTRMGALMATDSVILKSRSPFIEYYSRLQVPGAHYLEFWKDPEDPLDVLRLLEEARAVTTGDWEGLRAATQANQAIAARYLAMEPKLIYARAVLLAYHSLVPDMATCIQDLVQHLERSGHPLPEPGLPG